MSEMKIPLSRGLYAIVDADDFALVAGHRWAAVHNMGTWYARRTIREPGEPKTSQNMQTLITGWLLTDHINGNGLDNRRCNLRPASGSDNGGNARKRRLLTSRFKGVSWHARDRRWVATIGIAGKRTHLGYFASEDDAARAYDDTARRTFGSFAALNFPQEGEQSALDIPEVAPKARVPYSRAKRAATSSTYLGVSWNKEKSLWVARIGAGGRAGYLGTFTEEDAAARAYDVAAREYFGSRAVLNFQPAGVDR